MKEWERLVDEATCYLKAKLFVLPKVIEISLVIGVIPLGDTFSRELGTV